MKSTQQATQTASSLFGRWFRSNSDGLDSCDERDMKMTNPSVSIDAALEKPPKSDTGFESPMLRKSGFSLFIPAKE